MYPQKISRLHVRTQEGHRTIHILPGYIEVTATTCIDRQDSRTKDRDIQRRPDPLVLCLQHEQIYKLQTRHDEDDHERQGERLDRSVNRYQEKRSQMIRSTHGEKQIICN